MKHRNFIYLIQKKEIAAKLSQIRSLYIALETRASFPDSGYYYAGKQRQLNNLHDEMVKKVKPSKWKLFWDRLIAEGNKASYNYHESVAFIDDKGRKWTAADMDKAMVGC
jgi:hypothetical protein